MMRRAYHRALIRAAADFWYTPRLMTTQTIDRVRAATVRERAPDFLVRWGVPLLLALLALAVYLPTLSNVHTFDALSYIRDVDQRAGFFFHPHHLLYSPTGWLFWQAWRFFGYGGNSELPLKVLDSLVAAASGFGLYRLVLHVTGRWWAALTAAGLLLFNYGAWYFSVEVEVYLLALIWLIGVLALLIELVTQPRARTAPLLGIAVGFAALYHQTNGLQVPIVIAAALLSPVSWRERIKQLIVSGALAGGIVAAGYGLVGFGYNGYRSFSELRDWMTFFVRTGWWGRSTRGRWIDLGAGLGNSISTQGAWPFWLAIVAVLVLGLVSAFRRWPRIVAICGLWLAIYGGFFAWWEGDNIEFWIASLLPLWVLVGLSLAQLGTIRWGRPLAYAATVLPLLLIWHNYPIIKQRGDASQDLQRQLAVGVKGVTAPADLIVAPGGVMELYLPYYEDRPYVRTLNGLLFESNGDIPAALGRLQYEIDTALNAGLGVVVGREALELPQDIFQRYPLRQPQLDAFWAPYRASLKPAVINKGTTYFWRIAPATEIARGDGWRWRTSALGWQAANLQNAAFDQGWCFNPQSDPALVGPRLDIDAGEFKAVEVTLRTNKPNEQAQLFYADQKGAMSDANSVRWQLQGDGQSRTYTIPLKGAPGWSGWITRLRLDPVAVGDGTAATRTCVEAVRFVK